MPFLSQDQIKPEVKKKHLEKYKRQLKESLMNPLITPDQMADLKEKLRRVGKPKIYDPNSSPPPGAIEINQSNPS